MLTPTINVAPASVSVPPTVVNVQAPPSGFWRTWAPVLIAGLAAVIALSSACVSAWLSWRNQLYGIAKDAAATTRDGYIRRSAAALAAFENTVARPVGMALDRVEQMMVDLGRLRPIPRPAPPMEPAAPNWRVWRKERLLLPAPGPTPLEATVEQYGRDLVSDSNHALRLCREADAALAPSRTSTFAQRYFATHLEDLLLNAAEQALSPGSATGTDAQDAAIQAVVQLKVDLRRTLEDERAAEAQRWSEKLAHDPFFTEVQRWLPRRLRIAAQQAG